jgi:adenosine deaminase
MTVFSKLFRTARTEGLGVTLHIAEVRHWPKVEQKGSNKDFMEQKTGNSMAEETRELLSCEPERLGHGTYLDEEAKEVVLARRTCIEICLTSNLLCVIFLLGEFELSVRPMADAKRCSNSRITTSGITLLGTTPSPSVYVLPLPFIYFLA